jgi:hypothetical protein
MAKHKQRDEWVYMARVERDITGGVTLHLIPDYEHAELHDGDEFVIAHFTADPFQPIGPR